MSQGFTTPLAIPVPVSQGGTGVTTSTGTGSVVLNNNPNLIGTSTNDNAAAGSIGEFVSSIVPIGSAVALTSGIVANVTSISLTAGDWDVWGEVFFTGNTSTSYGLPLGAISLTSATLPTLPAVNSSSIRMVASGSLTPGANGTPQLPLAPARILIASTTTVYLITSVSFTVSTFSAYGKICARRVR